MNQSEAAVIPGGLQVSQGGYTLALAAADYVDGVQGVDFRIIGPDGTPVTAYEKEHEKELHLIAVRRDFAGFQHVHPTLDRATGVWSVDLDLEPGAWRIFADFVPAGGGAGLTLGVDLLVDGEVRWQLPSEEVRAAVAGDYEVTVAGDLAAGAHTMLDFAIAKDGEPFTALEPYLGAYGHLVALREGDLAYLHVHPGGEPGDGVTEPGPSVVFGTEVPSAGRYHLFLDFQADGVVHTAQFALEARAGAHRAAYGGSHAHHGHHH
ncbi:hypothetical protein ACLM5J_09205 [Nocardioides sp. Bht2]|uniref:hypothetical protein n=1 Tax=Nocardioides sp. Bht2 TaxID=3392297 RepID=UPI0039B3F19A